MSPVVLQNFLWMFGGRGVGAFVQISVVLVLARLLKPEEFGIISAALTVVALTNLFGRVGVAPAIIQTPELTDAQIRTATTTTLVLGVLAAGLIILLSESFAALYRMPDLAPIISAFSLLFVLRGIGMVSGAVLERNMRFRTLALITFLSYVLGYASVALTLAHMGFGYWALVWAQITQVALETISFIIFGHVGLSLGFHRSSFTKMMTFGLGVSLTQIGNYTARNIDYFVVGRFLGTASLGFYSRSYVLMDHASQIIGSVGDKVLFPALASMQSDIRRVERGLNKALAICVMTQLPLSILLITIGPEIIRVLLGQQWDETILPFQILISALVFRTGYKFINTAFRTTGKVYKAALWQWCYAAMVALGAFGGMEYGLVGVATGVTLAIVVNFCLGMIILWYGAGISTLGVVKSIGRYLLIALPYAVAINVLKSTLSSQGATDLQTVLTATLFTLVLYAGLFFAFPKLFGSEGQVIVEFIRRKRKNPNPT